MNTNESKQVKVEGIEVDGVKRFTSKTSALDIDVEQLTSDLAIINGEHDVERDGQAHRKFRDILFRTEKMAKGIAKIMTNIIKADLMTAERGDSKTVWIEGEKTKKKGSFSDGKDLNIPFGENEKPIMAKSVGVRLMLVQAVADAIGVVLNDEEKKAAEKAISKMIDVSKFKFDSKFYADNERFTQTNKLGEELGVHMIETFSIDGKVHEIT